MPEEVQYEPAPVLDRPRSSSAMAAVLIVFLVLLAGGGATYYFLRRTTPHAAPEARQAPESAAAPVTSAPAAPAVDLPPLDASDAFLRERLAGLGDEEWRNWLVSEGLARRFVASVLAVSTGRSPSRAIDRPRLAGRFAVIDGPDGARIDPASYARYDRIAASIAALDVEQTRQAYRLLRPLLDTAWGEIAPAGESLDDAARRAIDALLAAPEAPPSPEVTLAPEDGLYHYRDPQLEQLNAAQKHLLRMGPENAAKVRETLRALRSALL